MLCINIFNISCNKDLCVGHDICHHLSHCQKIFFVLFLQCVSLHLNFLILFYALEQCYFFEILLNTIHILLKWFLRFLFYFQAKEYFAKLGFIIFWECLWKLYNFFIIFNISFYRDLWFNTITCWQHRNRFIIYNSNIIYFWVMIVDTYTNLSSSFFLQLYQSFYTILS